MSALRIGIDTGGTFTDFVVYDPDRGSLESFKIASTPDDPARAVLQGIQQIARRSKGASLVHGSTVATNALLERKGARTALITTRGFRDVLAIGRQNRPKLYDLTPAIPPPLIPDELRFELDERINYAGEVLQPLDTSELADLIATLERAKVESVAVCFLFSFARSEHEALVADALRRAGIPVSSSYEILPEYREYERTATTVVNAYVSPVMDRYIGKLEDTLEHDSLQIMQSNGGVISPGEARNNAVRCILSGPAGGMIAAQALAGWQESEAKLVRALTFDMGGTSTDVSLIEGSPRLTTEGQIAGLPIGIPLLDIHTIGAGGGSIAHIDPGGNLRVGPQSAGANPGPACYGHAANDGSAPAATVTDANLMLGRLLPDRFLGGRMPLYPEQAEGAIRPLAEALDRSIEATAMGILQIANAHMARALRVISVERGHDPRDFYLVSFGGAGGLHAGSLGRELGIPRVVVPRLASTFSALGMLLADVVKDYAQTIMLTGEVGYERLTRLFAPLEHRGVDDLRSEGIPRASIEILRFLDVRYRGQSYDLRVPFDRRWREHFFAAQQAAYGFVPPGGELEVVNIRVQARGNVPRPAFRPLPDGGLDPGAARFDRRPVWFAGGLLETQFFDAGNLQPGNTLSGPAVIVRDDTTILVAPGELARVDSYENVVIEVGG